MDFVNILKWDQYYPRSNGWVGYIVNSKRNGRIYIAGDTDDIDEARKLRCDIALLPIGGQYTMNAEEAASLANEIKPRFAVPIHYGSIVGKSEDAEIFRENADKSISVVVKLAL